MEIRDDPPSKVKVAAVTLTSGALILDAATGGVLTFLSSLASLAADQLDDEQMQTLLDSTSSLEERVKALEATQPGVRRITGPALKVLISTVETEANNLYEMAGVDQVMDRWDMSPEEYRKGAEELDALGVVNAMAGGNAPSGIIRTKLQPEAFLQVGPGLLEEVAVGEEFLRVLKAVQEQGEERVPANETYEKTALPLPRFDLYVRAGEELGSSKGTGSGADPYSRYCWLTLTPLGRRLLRGDDPSPVGEGRIEVE